MKIKGFNIFWCLAISSLSVWAQSPTAPALGFNMFLQQGAKLATNETDGPIAMGGNLTLAGSYQVSTNYTGNYTVGGVKVTLVVGGKLIFQSGNSLQVNQNGYVKIGDSTNAKVWYKDQNNAYSPIRITNGNNYNGTPRINLQANAQSLNVSATNNPVFQSNLINFTSAFVQLKTNSTSLAACSDNATLTNANGNPIGRTGLPNQVKITLNNGANILNLNGTDLNSIQNFTFNNKPNASRFLIINVNAQGTFNWNVWNNGGVGFNDCPFILYNFYNTTTLNIQGNGTIEGTVLAPYADIIKTANQSNVEGQIIAQSYFHSGGENHYAVFSPSYAGCIAATNAEFSVNNSSQCIANNNFTFSNTSSGHGNITYNWNFGDNTSSTLATPAKTYAAAGTYTVTLTATATAGVDSFSAQLIVKPMPDKGFTINDTIQQFTNNSFVFTSTGNTSGNSYSWSFGDGDTSSSINPTHSYDTTGSYNVSQTVTNAVGCRENISYTVIVAGDSVGSGNGGGLESESLGGLVAKRDYLRIKNSFDHHIDYNKMPVFELKNEAKFKSNSANLQLADMIPEQLISGNILRVSTPTDLINLTAAVDVLSVDYTVNNQAKAVVLGIKTAGKAYSHTKSICDRLRGAKLISIQKTEISGKEFVLFALQQESGVIEYTISFVASTSNNRNDYLLQTNWLVSSYLPDDTLYTFQVWAARPDYTVNLVSQILSKLSSSRPVNQSIVSELPKAYITDGVRIRENLVLHINNSVNATSAKIVFEERANEESIFSVVEIPISLSLGNGNTITIPVKDGYEYDGELFVNNELVDRVYMADGNWGLDYDNQLTSVSQYTLSNDPDRVYGLADFPLYRNVSLRATTTDYISLYKAIKPGIVPANLSTYNWLNFYAKGKGSVEITLTKESLINWADQYRTVISLDENGKNHSIPFSDFISSASTAAFSPTDVKMLNFAFKSTNGISFDAELFVSNVSFGSFATGIETTTVEEQITVYPNPNNGSFQFSFISPKAGHMNYAITDLMGREIYHANVNAKSGSNSVKIDLGQMASKGGIFFLTLKGENINYGVRKIILE